MLNKLKRLMMLAWLVAIAACTTVGSSTSSSGTGGGGIGESKGRAVFGTDSDLMFRTLA